jgi:hypothetical protein
MSSLLDIGPLTASVTVRGKTFQVSGIGADTLVQLLNDYPELNKYMSGAFGGGGVDKDTLVKMGPEISDAIILAGAGFKATDEKAKAVVRGLTLGEKMDIFEPIMMMTFPRGFPAFVEALSRISGTAGEGEPNAASGKAPDTK